VFQQAALAQLATLQLQTHVTAGNEANFDGTLRLHVHINQSNQSL
jgi:hypothetical protein